MKKDSNSGLISLGLLLLRIGIGVMFLYHGWPKISGGPEKWVQVGQAISVVGITFGSAQFWGFMAAFSEFGGGILLIAGLFFRPACFLMMITMIVASLMHLKSGQGMVVAAHPIKMAIVFFSLLFTGAGDFNIAKLFFNRKKKK